MKLQRPCNKIQEVKKSMRLRKNMKRAAAAALALSVALSAAAPAALAKEYDISKGDITVTVKDNGDTYVLVGKAKDENDIGVIDDTAVVIKGGEDPDKQTENNSDGPADEDTADEAEGQKPVVDAEPGAPAEETGTELVVWPENVNSGEAQKKDGPAEEEQKTPDTQKPEGKTDAATLEASTEQKPVEEAAEDEDDDKDIMTFEDNTASTVTKAVSKAVKNIITIINNCTKKDTTVTIKDVNIDVSPSGGAAMSVQGQGDTTIHLEGESKLKSGGNHAGLEKNSVVDTKGNVTGGSTGKLTITADSVESGKLTAQGNGYAGFGAGIGSALGNDTANIEIAGGTVEATGGVNAAGIGSGKGGNAANIKISGGKVKAESGWYGAGIGTGYEYDTAGRYNNDAFNIEISNGDVTAIGNGGAGIGGGMRGNAYGIKITDGSVYAENNSGGNTGSAAIGGGYRPENPGNKYGNDKAAAGGYGEVTITGGKVTAIGRSGSAGIGGGTYGTGDVTISDDADVTAKGGTSESAGSGAAIGDGGRGNYMDGEERADLSGMTGGTVTRLDAQSNISAGHVHKWTEEGREATADGSVERVTYSCECGALRTVMERRTVTAEENSSEGAVVLTVTGAHAYEMYLENARYIVTADSDAATISSCLGNLAELKAQGADTLVFRTKSRETALDIDAMLSLGAEDTLFTLTHSGSSAILTVGGADHSELIH